MTGTAVNYLQPTDHEIKRVKRKIRTLSLFSGAGGLDIGFHQAGFDIITAVEIAKDYAATLICNTGNNEFFGANLKICCEDVRKFDPTLFQNQGIECVSYYLRLLPSVNEFVVQYTELVENDIDLDYQHRIAWNEICASFAGP